ncbi:MAG: hypothetical protein ACLUNZ_12050 [Evtepia sp.]
MKRLWKRILAVMLVAALCLAPAAQAPDHRPAEGPAGQILHQRHPPGSPGRGDHRRGHPGPGRPLHHVPHARRIRRLPGQHVRPGGGGHRHQRRGL